MPSSNYYHLSTVQKNIEKESNFGRWVTVLYFYYFKSNINDKITVLKNRSE